MFLVLTLFFDFKSSEWFFDCVPHFYFRFYSCFIYIAYTHFNLNDLFPLFAVKYCTVDSRWIKNVNYISDFATVKIANEYFNGCLNYEIRMTFGAVDIQLIRRSLICLTSKTKTTIFFFANSTRTDINWFANIIMPRNKH